MNTTTETVLTLINIKNIGPKAALQLIDNDVALAKTDEELLNNIMNCPGLSNKAKSITLDDIKEAKNRAKDILKECIKSNIGILTTLDDDFPANFRKIKNAPVLIYYKGNKECLNANKTIAIIGTRIPTDHGTNIALRLGYVLGVENFVVVSGLAEGCDEKGHIGCIEAKGRTVAVLPGGINRIYPRKNTKLAEDILNTNGCLISEYEPNYIAQKHTFIARDRLQSALAQGVIVIETNIKGGTMHTVNFAKEQNKLIGCYKHPEKYKNEPQVQGNIELLKDKENLPLHDNISLNYFINKLTDTYIG